MQMEDVQHDEAIDMKQDGVDKPKAKRGRKPLKQDTQVKETAPVIHEKVNLLSLLI